MNRSSSTTISAELGLRLVVPQQTIVPLVASMYYSGSDPYAVRMAFHVGTDEPVEWIFARDLLAAGIESRQGEGDVQVWPSPMSCAETDDLDVIGPADVSGKVLNIELSSPFGQAHFEAPAQAMTAFLQRTYQIVPSRPGKRLHQYRGGTKRSTPQRVTQPSGALRSPRSTPPWWAGVTFRDQRGPCRAAAALRPRPDSAGRGRGRRRARRRAGCRPASSRAGCQPRRRGPR